MNLWQKLGFRENPYNTDPIPPNDEGVRLLVGRDDQLKQICMLLQSSNNHPTIEGANGVGKTSLVGVAAYILSMEYKKNPEKRPLFLPVQNPFQLSATESAELFSEKFMLTIMQEIIREQELIKKHHSGLRNLPLIDDWLNNPIIRGGGGSASIFGVGGGIQFANSANSGAGFSKSGLEVHLREMLESIFPKKDGGGFVCVLDNLELLDTSTKAKSTLESLRDGILSFPGIRWVLCGARGIVRSVVSTPRLQGKLSTPIELQPLSAEQVKSVIEKRLQIFRTSEDAYTPIDTEGFQKIYEITNFNLRIALKYCEDFVYWCETSSNKPLSSGDKLGLLDAWFAETAEEALTHTSDITDRGWNVFDGISNKKEGISPGDYEEFNFNSAQALQPYLRVLEQAALIESSTTDTDKRRKTITLTPRGWIVRYRRRGYKIS